MIRQLSIITSGYPTPSIPHRGTFIQQLAEAASRHGAVSSVISPIARHRFNQELQGNRRNLQWESNGVEVFHPLYFSLGYSGHIGFYHFARFTQWQVERTVYRCWTRMIGKTDAFYGHFAYVGGAAAVRMSQLTGIPAFVGIGESTFEYVEEMGYQRVHDMYKRATGVITVSKMLARKIIGMGLVDAERIGVFPNGVNRRLFYPRDRQAMRDELNIPNNLFVVAFAGRLTHAKGVGRLIEAIGTLSGVGILLLGQAVSPISCPNALHIGPVPHIDMPKYISAADIFVLPTLSEGCCNTILEALACGLPVISSSDEFNDDILNESISIRVNPYDISEIRKAILHLRDNPNLCKRMSDEALVWSRQFDIDIRARNILSFIEDKIKQGRRDW